MRTVIGAFVIGIMSNALNILGITAYHQQIVKGLLIIITVSMDIWNQRLRRVRLVHDNA